MNSSSKRTRSAQSHEENQDETTLGRELWGRALGTASKDEKAFEGCDVSWVTVREGYRVDLEDQSDGFFVIPDATRWNKIGLVILLFRVMLVIIKVRPHAIVTTGAAPGLLALMIGRLLGCKTCWIDSIANMEEMSLSGKKAQRWATLWLTQWAELSSENGPEYHGSVLQNFCEQDCG